MAYSRCPCFVPPVPTDSKADIVRVSVLRRSRHLRTPRLDDQRPVAGQGLFFVSDGSWEWSTRIVLALSGD